MTDSLLIYTRNSLFFCLLYALLFLSRYVHIYSYKYIYFCLYIHVLILRRSSDCEHFLCVFFSYSCFVYIHLESRFLHEPFPVFEDIFANVFLFMYEYVSSYWDLSLTRYCRKLIKRNKEWKNIVLCQSFKWEILFCFENQLLNSWFLPNFKE